MVKGAPVYNRAARFAAWHRGKILREEGGEDCFRPICRRGEISVPCPLCALRGLTRFCIDLDTSVFKQFGQNVPVILAHDPQDKGFSNSLWRSMRIVWSPQGKQS